MPEMYIFEELEKLAAEYPGYVSVCGFVFIICMFLNVDWMFLSFFVFLFIFSCMCECGFGY